jgi:curved DNA-binding protein CbpA
MPALLESLERLFETKDLYAVLGVDKKCSPDQIKKGYHKRSLKIHPDRVADEKDRPKATEKFQCLGI